MQKVVSFTETTVVPSSYRPEPDRILDGDPLQNATLVFTSGDGRFSAGSWTAERGKWRVAFTENEFCHLLEGVIVVTDEAGRQTTFRAGDSFVSPAGFTGTWEIVERARKVFAFYE